VKTLPFTQTQNRSHNNSIVEQRIQTGLSIELKKEKKKIATRVRAHRECLFSCTTDQAEHQNWTSIRSHSDKSSFSFMKNNISFGHSRSSLSADRHHRTWTTFAIASVGGFTAGSMPLNGFNQQRFFMSIPPSKTKWRWFLSVSSSSFLHHHHLPPPQGNLPVATIYGIGDGFVA
jgi:hypothetical protein